jgi:hypothetical protein
VTLALRGAREPGTNRHTIGTSESQTRAPNPGIVAPEGGGTRTPTLGGGIWVTRARVNMGGAAL